MKELHQTILSFLKNKEGNVEVKELYESPNKYGDITGNFSWKFNYKDKYNFVYGRLSIDYSRKVAFIPDVGYLPYTSFDEIKQFTQSKYK